MSYEDIDKLTDTRASTLAFSEIDSERILFPPDLTLSTDFLGSLSQRLEFLKKKEIRNVLHGSTLSQYWRNKRIPRGLRINKEPTIGRLNESFCKKWCDILNKCSLDLMLLVIEHANEEISKVRAEITDVQNEMKSKFDAQQLKDIDDRCTALLDSYRKEILEVKLRKYRRDTLDYKNNRVYQWLSNPIPARTMRTSRQTIDSLSSGLSTDESGSDNASTGTANRFLSQGGRQGLRSQNRRGDRHAGAVRNTEFVARRGRAQMYPT